MQRVLMLAGAILALMVAVVGVKTARYGTAQPRAEPVEVPEDRARPAAEKLARALTFRTVSHEDPADFDTAEFRRFHDYLEQAFPAAHGVLERDTVNGLSLLYTWPGTDPDQAPVLLTGHFDVVPIEPGTADEWDHPPFAGEIAEGFVWGRGALDDKVAVITLLQAVETLAEDGFRPERTVYIAFGHDEEVGGHRGAVEIVQTLEERGVHPAWMLDEGGVVADGMIPGVEPPVALVQIAEKGYLSLELTARAPGGHSSMPPENTAVGILSRAVARLEDKPMPARLIRPVRELFAHLAPELPTAQRALFANQWLFAGLIESQMASEPRTNAMIRTTTAPTIFHGGVQENVLPTRARAVVNFRLLPGDTTDGLMARVARVIDDPRVQIEPLGFRADPPPVSDPDTEAFRLIARTARSVFPGAVAAPSLLVATTDSRHYQALTDKVYRFRPTRVGAGQLSGVHGTNERVAVDTLAPAVTFFRELIRRGAGG